MILDDLGANSPGRFGPGRVRSRVLLPSGFSLLPSSFPLSACLRSKFPLVPSPLTCLRCKFSLLPSPLALRRLLPSSLGPVLSSLTSNGGAAPKKIACLQLRRSVAGTQKGPKGVLRGPPVVIFALPFPVSDFPSIFSSFWLPKWCRLGVFLDFLDQKWGGIVADNSCRRKGS